MAHHHEVLSDARESFARLRRLVPDVATGYANLDRAAMQDGALSAKHKQLIALAIAVSKECDGCIASHARGAARRRASEAEVAEAIGVAILLNGGPGTVWGPRALMAFREFAESISETPAS